MSVPPDLVVYHGNCFDGAAAAWALSLIYPNARYVGVSHDDPFKHLPLEDYRDKRVVVLDYCFKREILDQIAGVVGFIYIYDHHASAKGVYIDHRKGLITLDMNRSGAQIAWDSFHSTGRPPIIEYVGDRDLWTFRLPKSKEINAYVYSMPPTIESVKALHEGWDEQKYIAIGETLLAARERDVKTLAKGFWRATMVCDDETYTVMVGDCNWIFRSDVGNYVMESGETSGSTDKCDFVVLYSYYANTKTFNISLRGKNKVDLSVVAKKFGGGGHPNASGFSSPNLDFLNV